MSIAAKLQGWLSFSTRRQDRLLTEARALAAGILPPGEAVARARELPDRVRQVDGKDRWKSWRWLIATHNVAQDQLPRLRDCRGLITRSKSVGRDLDQDAQEAFANELIVTFRGALRLDPAEVSSLTEVDGDFEECEKKWLEIAEKVREERPPVFVSHAFLRLSDSTGLEIASLFVAGVIGLGAIYMAFFYATAAGQAPTAYWTLDDLIIQGITILPQLFVALVVVEVVFGVVRRIFGGKGSYRWHGMIVAHPLLVAFGFFVVMAVVLAMTGHEQGEAKLADFKSSMKPEEKRRQMATVLDRSVLENVFLVGTTDRTAIFLQLKDPKKSVDVRAPTLRETVSCVLSSFGIWDESCVGGHRPNHRVLVMDRALVVCHAKMDECEEVKPPTEDPETTVLAVQLSELDRKVGVIEQWAGSHHKRVRTEFGIVATHLNDHLDIVLDEIGKANRGSTAEGTTGAADETGDVDS